MTVTTEGAAQTAAADGPSPVAQTRRRLPPMTLKLAVGLTLTGLIVLFGVLGPFLVGNPSTVRDVGLAGQSEKCQPGRLENRTAQRQRCQREDEARAIRQDFDGGNTPSSGTH